MQTHLITQDTVPASIHVVHHPLQADNLHTSKHPTSNLGRSALQNMYLAVWGLYTNSSQTNRDICWHQLASMPRHKQRFLMKTMWQHAACTWLNLQAADIPNTAMLILPDSYLIL